MTWTSSSILAVAELIIYLLLSPILLYTAFKHRLPGLPAHVFLTIFVVLRIVADGISISDRNDTTGVSTAGAIVNSIGVSPLILAVNATISEARRYIVAPERWQKQKKMVVIYELLMHVLVVGGVVLVAVGSAHASKDSTQTDFDRDLNKAKAGAILLLSSWVVTLVWAFFTLRGARGEFSLRFLRRPECGYIACVILALPFLGARVVYAVVSVFDRSPSTHLAVVGGFAVEFTLVFLMQLVVAALLMTGLFVSRNLRREKEGLVTSYGTSMASARRGGGAEQMGSVKDRQYGRVDVSSD